MSLASNFQKPYWLSEIEQEQTFVLLLASVKPEKNPQEYFVNCFSELGIQDLVVKSVSEIHTEILFKSKPSQAWILFNSVLSVSQPKEVDIAVLPLVSRKIKLLVCDMDSTIVTSETLDDVADKIGIGEKVKQITDRAMRGELDFQQALNERVALLKGLEESVFHEIANEVCLNDGAQELIQTAREHEIKTVLVSGGFEPIVKVVAEQLGFDRYVCNRLDTQNGILTGKVMQPIVDSSTKLNVLKQEAELLDVSLYETCAVGDGANDLPMLQAAGIGFAYRGKPLLKQSIPYQLNHTDLDNILWMIGIA